MSEETSNQTTDLLKGSIWDVYFPRNVDTPRESVPIASFPMIIYFWPAMLAFLIGGLLQTWGWAGAAGVGTAVTIVLAFNLMVIVTDLDQKKFVIALLLVGLFSMGVYIANTKEWGIVTSVSEWFAALELTYSNDVLLLMGSLLLIFFLMGMAQPRFDYWKLEANEFVHYIQPWGRDQSIPRQGSTVTREVPDVLELILTFGGGTIVIKRDGNVVARIEHVPFLGRRMRAIEKLLSSTRVTVTG